MWGLNIYDIVGAIDMGGMRVRGTNAVDRGGVRGKRYKLPGLPTNKRPLRWSPENYGPFEARTIFLLTKIHSCNCIIGICIKINSFQHTIK